MDDLHAAIAAFLRSQRPAASRAAADRPGLSMHRQRVFPCRFCGGQVWEGEHGAAFHFNELLEAVSCAACHRERLRQEAQVGGAGALLRQAWHRAAMVKPRCKRCGEIIGDGGATDRDVEQLRADRVCADCYMPF